MDAIELRNHIPVYVTRDKSPTGQLLNTPVTGYAIAWHDVGMENHMFWIVVIDDFPYKGQVWVVPNNYILVQDNWTLGR